VLLDISPMAASLLSAYHPDDSKFRLPADDIREILEALRHGSSKLLPCLIAIRCTIQLVVKEPSSTGRELYMVRGQLLELEEEWIANAEQLSRILSWRRQLGEAHDRRRAAIGEIEKEVGEPLTEGDRSALELVAAEIAALIAEEKKS
jgi:hypothetical protein